MDRLVPEPVPVTRRALLIRADAQLRLEVLADALGWDPDVAFQVVLSLGLNELARFAVEAGRVAIEPLRPIDAAPLAKSELDVINE